MSNTPRASTSKTLAHTSCLGLIIRPTPPGRLRPKTVCRVDGLLAVWSMPGAASGFDRLIGGSSSYEFYDITEALAASSSLSHIKAPRVAWSKRRDRLVSSSKASSGNQTPGRTLSETRVSGRENDTTQRLNSRDRCYYRRTRHIFSVIFSSAPAFGTCPVTTDSTSWT